MTAHVCLRRGVILCAAASLVALGAAGCSSTKPASKPTVDEGWEVRVESPLDTLTVTPGPEATGELTETAAGTAVVETGPILDTPQVTETKAAAAPPTVPASGGSPPGPNTVTAPPPAAVPALSSPEKVYIPGWRIQVFASSSMSNADAISRKARQRFTEPVYVEFDPPLYKVRVGDFLSKEDARHMANRAKAEGYDAWVVEALVIKP
jgi:cell division septation protein DedD